MVEQEELKRIPESQFDQELNLENRLIQTDGATIGGVEVLYVGRQGSPGDGGIFDILGVDENGDPVIIELKRDRAPRDIVAQALEYASEIRTVDYGYLADQYRRFCLEEQAETDSSGILELNEAHAEFFDIDEPLVGREFNNNQRLIVVGTEFMDVSLNMADFLRDHGIDVVCVEYQSYATDDKSVELVTTEAIRRPLSEEPTGGSTPSGPDYSDLLTAIRDRTYAQVADMLQLESRDQVTAGKRELRFSSKDPGHPDSAIYRFKPRLDNPDRPSNIDLIVWGGSDEEKNEVRQIVANYASELDQFELTEEYQDSMIVLRRDIHLNEKDLNSQQIDKIATDIADLINHIHPILVK